MRKVKGKQLPSIIYICGGMMTVIAVVVSVIQTNTIVRAIKKYSPYN
ncbi:hypothetical protein ACQ0QQ_16785 [Lysinibacillus sphaericus]